MKKYLPRLLAFIFLSLSLASCSSEETSTADIHEKNRLGLESGNWEGVIATENPDGTFEFRVDPQLLMQDLEEELSSQGEIVDLQTISIEKKVAANDEKSIGYMLIASDGQGVSTGLMLQPGKTKSDRDFQTEPDPSTIICRGCATGCNLEHLNMPDGGKVPYCKTNGCGDFCQTKYSS